MSDETIKSDVAKWYVVHTYSGYENKVASDIMTSAKNRGLADKIVEVKIPTEKVTEIKTVKPKANKKPKKKAQQDADIDENIDDISASGENDNSGVEKVEVEHKLYPCYVFVKMICTDDAWYIVRNTRGCTGFVGPDSKPIPLTDEEVIHMGVETKSVNLEYKVGDEVMIVKGHFSNQVGVVERIDIVEESSTKTAGNDDEGLSKVYVKIPMFGRETVVDFELDEVQLLKK